MFKQRNNAQLSEFWFSAGFDVNTSLLLKAPFCRAPLLKIYNNNNKEPRSERQKNTIPRMLLDQLA